MGKCVSSTRNFQKLMVQCFEMQIRPTYVVSGLTQAQQKEEKGMLE